jgi:hypothetical protein
MQVDVLNLCGTSVSFCRILTPPDFPSKIGRRSAFLLFPHFSFQFTDRNAKQNGDQHIGQRAAEDQIRPHQKSVEHEANKPDKKVLSAAYARFLTSLQDKEVRDLYGDHRRKDRADEI